MFVNHLSKHHETRCNTRFSRDTKSWGSKVEKSKYNVKICYLCRDRQRNAGLSKDIYSPVGRSCKVIFLITVPPFGCLFSLGHLSSSHQMSPSPFSCTSALHRLDHCASLWLTCFSDPLSIFITRSHCRQVGLCHITCLLPFGVFSNLIEAANCVVLICFLLMVQQNQPGLRMERPFPSGSADPLAMTDDQPQTEAGSVLDTSHFLLIIWS